MQIGAHPASKQVVAGSSPAAPTNSFNHIQQRSTSDEGLCDADCDVTVQFAFLIAVRSLGGGPSLNPLSGLSSAVRFAAMRT